MVPHRPPKSPRIGTTGRVVQHSGGFSWATAEFKVLDRFAELVKTGDIISPRQATFACKPELDRLHRSAQRRNPDAYGGGLRTWSATYNALRARIPMRLRLKYRHRSRWGSKDLRIAERFAQATAAGEYANAHTAAAACYPVLLARHRTKDEGGPVSLNATYDRIRIRTRELGAPAAFRRLTPAEREIVDVWVDRYWNTRDFDPPWPQTDLAELMMIEMRQKGHTISVDTCIHVLGRAVRLSRAAREKQVVREAAPLKQDRVKP